MLMPDTRRVGHPSSCSQAGHRPYALEFCAHLKLAMQIRRQPTREAVERLTGENYMESPGFRWIVDLAVARVLGLLAGTLDPCNPGQLHLKVACQEMGLGLLRIRALLVGICFNQILAVSQSSRTEAFHGYTEKAGAGCC